MPAVWGNTTPPPSPRAAKSRRMPRTCEVRLAKRGGHLTDLQAGLGITCQGTHAHLAWRTTPHYDSPGPPGCSSNLPLYALHLYFQVIPGDPPDPAATLPSLPTFSLALGHLCRPAWICWPLSPPWKRTGADGWNHPDCQRHSTRQACITRLHPSPQR